MARKCKLYKYLYNY